MKIHVWLNEHEITREIAADLPLLEFVRSEGCYSVKRGCETSNCGLCTVWIDHKPVLSCSVLAARADGTHITTLEGVEDRAKEFGTYLAKQGGEQCGFCNPGFIMNVLAMEDEFGKPDGGGYEGNILRNLWIGGYESQLHCSQEYLKFKMEEKREQQYELKKTGKICQRSRNEKRCDGACDRKTGLYG